MSVQIEQHVHDLAIHDDLITSFNNFKSSIRRYRQDYHSHRFIEINNKVKQLEAEKNSESELLQEELRIMTLRNKFLGRPNKTEEETDLRRQTKKKIDNIEELKEKAKEREFKRVKILQDLNYAKNDEIVEIAKIELKLKRLRVSKKSIISLKDKLFQRSIYILSYKQENKSV